MRSDRFLHELKDFADLVRVVSGEKRILPQLIEKDYWIMHSLYGLQQQGFTFELKGGTSLSKGYRIIERFSEDIDIRIEPPPELEVKCGRNHTKPAQVESRRRFFGWLAETIRIPGIIKVERDHAFDTKDYFSGGIRLNYSELFPIVDDLKHGILLEVGFDDTTPNESRDISSWARDKAAAVNVAFTDNRAMSVKCYDPAFTLIEKLQAVSTKFRKQQEAGDFPANFLQHYYDIYCLLGEARVIDFIGTDEYEKRKEKRFSTADVRRIADNEAFLLRDPKVRKLYKTEYDKTAGLYYAGMIPFEIIMERIQQYFDLL